MGDGITGGGTRRPIAMALYFFSGALTALVVAYLFYVFSRPEGF